MSAFDFAELTRGPAGPTGPEGPEGPMGAGGALTLIEEQVLASAVTSVTFSSIPQTYRALRLLFKARGDTVANNTLLYFQGNAAWTNGNDYLFNHGGTTGYTATACQVAFIPAVSIGSAAFAVGWLEIYGYALVQQHAMTGFYAARTAASGTASSDIGARVVTVAFPNNSTAAALNRIVLTAQAGNIIAGSRFALYGIS